MFCPHCGKEIQDDTTFCPFCGKGCTDSNLPVQKNSKGTVEINNLNNNSNLLKKESKGIFTIYEHKSDLSVTPTSSFLTYFMEQMNVKKRQVLCELNGNSIRLQAGAMQWMSGNVEMKSNVKSVGDFFGKLVKGAITGESAVKPVYRGTGMVMLEPTYRYLLIEDVASWGSGIVLDDGLFLACDSSITETITSRNNVSSALLGGEGLFNLCLSGNGFCVLESPVPREELIEFNLNDSCVKIDGNMAIAWSSSLEFTVEKSSKSLIGSALSGEGFVNVYRGTGKILMAPTLPGTVHDYKTKGPSETEANSSQGLTSSIANSIFKL
jgi:uncharacterized protein (AIM24 family)/endogenous inhibitor of DNA gyrase (YacG/DUF329 family)